MGPQAHKPSAKDRLLDAADALFYWDGIANTGVDDVLARAEVSVATLYAHFGSKDGLIAATLQRRLSTWRSLWDEAISAADTNEGRLLALFDALQSYRERHPRARWCAFLSTATEMPAPGHIARPLIEADTALLLGRLRYLAKPLAGQNADELAASILLIYNGALAAFLRGHPNDPISHARKLAILAIEAARTQPHISKDDQPPG